MAYDRDAVVGFLKRHYDLLVRMAYLDPAVIEEPPPSGWGDDQLAVDILRVLGRSEKVIDLVRHLPYLQVNKEFQIYPETSAISYRCGAGWFKGQTAESCQGQNLGYLCLMPFDEDCPPGFISLTHGDMATCWIIDTDEGVVFPAGPHIVDRNAPADQPWRQACKPRDIKDYFDELYSEMMSLKVVPAPRAGKWNPAVLCSEGPEGQVIKRLLIQHGWPDDLNKVEYVQAVQTERAEYIESFMKRESSPSSTKSLHSSISHSISGSNSPRASPTSDSVHRIEDWVLEGDESQGEHTS